MSQFYKGVTAGDLPPDVPLEFVTDDGTAVPVDNTLNLLADDTQQNNENGITTTASGDTVTILLTNRIQTNGTSFGSGDEDFTLLSFDAAPFVGTPGTYTVDLQVAGFEPTTPASAIGNIFGGIRTDGTTPVLVGKDEFYDAESGSPIVGSTATLEVVGNDLVLRINDTSGLNIRWDITGTYTRSV